MEKFSDMYLMKIQISFWLGKIFKSIFNENTDQFFFYSEKFLEKFSNLYLVKIQICVCLEKNLDLYLMKIQICVCLKKVCSD